MTGNIKSHETDTRFFGSDTNSLELLGAANVNVNGSALSDLIVGNKGNNVISGMAGNDIIFGGRGSDILIGGVGNDVLVGGSSDRITGAQHTPDDGAFTGFNLTTDAFRFDDASALEFQTGDKVIYKASGGSGISVAGTGLLTETTPLFLIVGNANTNGSVDVKFASSLANARSGVALDIISNGNATTHGITIDNGAYGAATTNPAAVSLAGSDYLYGGSGQDHLIATGVTGSLTLPNVRDVLTMSGGSGNDEFSILGNSGKINIIGGSGSDQVNVFDNFLDIVGVNKTVRVLDFSAAQDDILSTFNPADLGVVSVESRLSNSGLTLSQLVSPPLPIVSGDAENGNYQETNGEIAKSIIVELNDYSLNIADLINLHQAHAA
jgi:Ca2+-binding RTX toxin-like protein